MARRSIDVLREHKQTKAERLAEAIDHALEVGKPADLPVVDFADPKRPPTCLEIDFPILPINQIAAIEGNAGKPIYQMSKWWARRRSSVFRSLLLAAATRAPDDSAGAAKLIWDNYYRNHQKNAALSNLKVADIFMGGGTTLVEGARLGMQMFGNDLNPVAWFVVKNELAQVKREEVEALLADIEAEVKPQIMPFFACNGPNGERGAWTHVATGKVMGDDFDPLALKPEERKDYSYHGPEIIYVFWAKHGPCQRTGCGHRTPIMSSPVLAVKEISVKAWPGSCEECGASFDIEEGDVRMAPDAPLVVARSERNFTPLSGQNKPIACPDCGHKKTINLAHVKGTRKKVQLSLLIHPEWLAGEAHRSSDGNPHGGSVTDSAENTARWNQARAHRMRLVEVRGPLPDIVECPETGATINTKSGTVPKDAHFACGACGTLQRTVSAMKVSGRSGPVTPYLLQGYSPQRDASGAAYGGRFFASINDTRSIDAALREWERRKDTDLARYWPRSEIPFGHMTHQRQPLPDHGYLRWQDMFNSRQLLVNALLLRAIHTVSGDVHRWEVREYVLAVFQQYLRNQNMFCFWDQGRDHLVPHLSNNNFHPKANLVENGVFLTRGRGNWRSCEESLFETLEWSENPWELASTELLRTMLDADVAKDLKGKSEKSSPGDRVLPGSLLACGSATDLGKIGNAAFDLVITDPPFGGLLHYSELSDFFYVWLRLVLKERYPDEFSSEYTPKVLEAVSNKARQPEDPDGYYRKLLALAWKQAHRILKPAGILAFTFHHSEDSPWIDVLESLFEGGFYLAAVYPIRSDETKGEGEFGSKQVEYDIIHVCRRRTDDPKSVSWPMMRRQVVEDIRGLKDMLELHQKAGLPDADLQVIRRGKALEYYSRHYGKVITSGGEIMTIREAMAGINVLLEEELGAVKNPAPNACDGMTRQFLRIFHGVDQVPRDQVQKYLRGTSIAPSQFEDRGWCYEKSKIFHLTSLLEIARQWQGKPRNQLVRDYDQAAYLIGACFEDSKINLKDALTTARFCAHPALDELIRWFEIHGPTHEIRTAAQRAGVLLRSWLAQNLPPKETLPLFPGTTH